MLPSASQKDTETALVKADCSKVDPISEVNRLFTSMEVERMLDSKEFKAVDMFFCLQLV